MSIMREIERLYTSLISWGPHKFKDGFNLADKDERMRKGGKGEMGETSYILIIPMVFWRVVPWGSVCVCVCRGRRAECAGADERSWRASMKSPVVLCGGKFSMDAAPKLCEVDTFPFNYSTTCTRSPSSGGFWVTPGLNTHACLHTCIQMDSAHTGNTCKMICAAYCWKVEIYCGRDLRNISFGSGEPISNPGIAFLLVVGGSYSLVLSESLVLFTCTVLLLLHLFIYF